MEVKKVLLVFSTVLVTLFSALLLNFAAKTIGSINSMSILILCIVLAINFGKFIVWGIIYKKYDLSEAYPLVSLFFPLIYGVAIFTGESDLTLNKSIGVLFILIGAFIMNIKKNPV